MPEAQEGPRLELQPPVQPRREKVGSWMRSRPPERSVPRDGATEASQGWLKQHKDATGPVTEIGANSQLAVSVFSNERIGQSLIPGAVDRYFGYKAETNSTELR